MSFVPESHSAETQLAMSHVEEMIALYGTSTIYVPRSVKKYDGVLGEDAESRFEAAYPLKAYADNSGGEFEGQSSLFTKFGIQVRESTVLYYSASAFADAVTAHAPDITRPREGDLVYLTRHERLFQIREVKKPQPRGVAFGTMLWYESALESYEYSNEIFDTGNATIDAYAQMRNTNVPARLTPPTDEHPWNQEPAGEPEYLKQQDNEALRGEADDLIDRTVVNPLYVRK